MGTNCVKAHTSATADWDASWIYTSAGVIYFRVEYKQNTDCGGKTYSDTHYGGAYKMPSLGQTLSVTIPPR